MVNVALVLLYEVGRAAAIDWMHALAALILRAGVALAIAL